MTEKVTQATHTPGPWSFSDNGKGRGRSARHTYDLVHSTTGHDYRIGTVYGITEQDRALIAAAPALLRALKGILEGTSPNWVDVARAAISQAEGRA